MAYMIKYFTQFKKLVGSRVYYLLASMFIVGFVECIGVTLFLPILQKGFGDDRISQVLKVIFGYFNLEFSFKLFLGLIAVFFTFRAVLMTLYERYFDRLLSDLLVRMREKMLNKIFAVDYLYILKKEMGYINNIIVRETPCVVDAFKNFTGIFKGATLSIIYVILSFVLNFRITIIAIVLGLVVFFVMKNINMVISRISRKITFSHGRYYSILAQCLGKIKYLKATDSYPKISRIVEDESRTLGSLRFRSSFLQVISKNLIEPVLVLAVVGLLFYYVVVLKKDVNEMMFLVILFTQVARQLLDVQGSYRKFLASIGSIEIVNNFEAELDKNKESLNTDRVPPDFREGIALKDVTVVFPNGKKALDKINMAIKPKSVVALVGHSGSGKSTIANLVTGILKPTGGQVLFGDVSYEKINLKILRENIGYITQEDIIFNASIKNNISLWDKNADSGTLKKIIEIAHITAFVDDLPEKLDSMLGDNGLNISGGQRQRITIARELYKDAKLLILDEATSSLDSESERQIYENLKEFKGVKTMLVIAHRLSTIKNADYIYVFHNSRIVEEGTFEELSNDKQTKFYHICQLQSV